MTYEERNSILEKKLPRGIHIIVICSKFYSSLVLISILLDIFNVYGYKIKFEPDLTKVHGIYINEFFFRCILFFFLVLISYGLNKLRKWALILVLFYSIYFLIVNVVILIQNNGLHYISNIIWPIILILYFLKNRNEFFIVGFDVSYSRKMLQDKFKKIFIKLKR